MVLQTPEAAQRSMGQHKSRITSAKATRPYCIGFVKKSGSSAGRGRECSQHGVSWPTGHHSGETSQSSDPSSTHSPIYSLGPILFFFPGAFFFPSFPVVWAHRCQIQKPCVGLFQNEVLILHFSLRHHLLLNIKLIHMGNDRRSVVF